MPAAMNARSTIDLTQFEQIEAGSGMVLLRLAAAASAELSPTQRPILLVDEAEQHADELRTLREQATTERKEEVDRLRGELAAQAERAAAITADLQAGVEIACAEATQHRDDAKHVRSQLEQAQAAATGAERRAAERAAELERLRDQADSAREATAEAEQTASERAAEVARLRSELERHTDAAVARASELHAQVEIATADAESTATHRITALEAVIDSSIAEADEQRQRAEELQAEVERARDAGERLQAARDQRLEQVEAELQRVRAEAEQALEASGDAHAGAEHRIAELDEAQTRAEMLAEVVRVESARREGNLTELTAARQTVERLEQELREREAALPRAELVDGAAIRAPAPRPAGQPSAQRMAPAPVAPPGGTGHVAVGVPERIRSVTQALPAQALVGIALVVLGIVIAILFLTGALG